MDKLKAGLYLVSTPIGNMKDISERALYVLEACDLVVAEDTRVSAKLLNSLGIKKPMESYHKYNEEAKAEQVIKMIKDEDKAVVLVSDAGAPCVSDAGMIMVEKAYKNGVYYTHIGGASAVISAFVLAGIKSPGFDFYEFLPVKESEKIEVLEEMSFAKRASIFFESPNRVLKTLADLDKLFPLREIALVKEISKVFERVIKGTANEVISFFNSNPDVLKGEFVFVIAPDKKVKEEFSEENLKGLIEGKYSYLIDKLSKKDLAKFVAEDSGFNKKDVYNFIQNL